MEFNHQKTKIFVFAGPSGAGKTTVVNRLLQDELLARSCARVITYTTRPPRPAERHGVEYHFLCHEQFMQRAVSEYFVETTEYAGYVYGTAYSSFSGMDVWHLAILDEPGVAALKKCGFQVCAFWLYAPSVVVQQRLLDRCDTVDAQYRIANGSCHELPFESSLFDYIICNDDFDVCVSSIKVALSELIKNSSK